MNALPGLCLLAPLAYLAFGGLGRDESAAPAPFERIEYTGRITGWHVTGDGRVSLRLLDDAQSDGKPVWFRTPADKTDVTRFEELMLLTVLQLSAADQALTVVYERDKERSGKTVDTAFPIVALVWGAPMAEVLTEKRR